jgi:uncharacterized protein YjbJ (UPF0337 family)
VNHRATSQVGGHRSPVKGETMNKDQIKGKIEEIKGDIKERIGGATKDRSTQAEGFVENKKGKLRSGIGDVKEELEREQRTPRDEPEEP